MSCLYDFETKLTNQYKSNFPIIDIELNDKHIDLNVHENK